MSHVTTRNLKLTHCLRRLLYRRNAALALMAPGLAFAGPSGEVVVGGEADIVRPDANNTVINQFTDRAAINWQTFSVDADEYVIFNQPDASSIMLNRVIGGDASYILGHLQSNGQVFLLNPHGVYFTHGASLDVQGFLASTLDMNPNDFMAGDFTLTRSDSAPATGRVINDGEITAGPGGYVVLAGDYTENTGIITAQAGSIALVSGNALTLDIEGDGLVSFAIDEATLSDAAGVRNAGSLIADGGMIVMTAQVASDLVATAVNNEGLVRAHSIEEWRGEIYLVGNGGNVVNAGTLDADGENADGGVVMMYSDRDITLVDGAAQTAAGDESHKGGFMRFVAEEHLDYQQDNIIRATGGVSGGFVEVSGHGGISLLGIPQIGPGGQLLIDPQWMVIRNDANTAPVYYLDASSYNPINLFGALPSYVANSDSLTAVNTSWISGQLQQGVDITLVAEQGMFVDTVTTPVGIFDSTGGGNLTIGIGYADWAGASTTDAIDAGSANDGTKYLGGVFDGAAMPTITWLPGGKLDLNGLDFNILGDLDVRADAGTVGLGEINANNINVTTGIGVGQINIGGGSFGSISATNNITITGGSITTAYISNANNVTINGNVGGSNFQVGSSAAVTNVRNLAVNGNINVANGVRLNVGSGSIKVNGTITAGSNVSFLASGNSFGPGNINAGFTSAGGAINVTATGPAGAGSGGNINFTSGLRAGGSIGISVTSGISGGGDLVIGGPISATGTGYVEVHLSGENVKTGSITVLANPDSFTSTFETNPTADTVETVIETVNAGGLARISISAGGPGSITVGSLSATGPDAEIVLNNAQTFATGGIKVTATGNDIVRDITLNSTASLGGALIASGQETIRGGQAGLFVNGTLNAGNTAINIGGDINVSAPGFASVQLAAGNVSTRSINTNAMAGLFVREGDYFGGSSRSGGGQPFGQVGFGAPTIDVGTLEGGSATIGIYGNPMAVLCDGTCDVAPPSAANVDINGNLVAGAPGNAMIAVFGNNIGVSGGVNATATRGMTQGTYYQSSDLGGELVGVVNADNGDAQVHLEGLTSAGYTVKIGGAVNVGGPMASLEIRGHDINLGNAVTVNAAGGKVDVTETLYSGSIAMSESRIVSSNLITPVGIQGTGAVAINGDITVSGPVAAGMLLQGNTVSARNIDIAATAGTVKIKDPAFRDGNEHVINAGNAILGVEAVTGRANIQGNVTVNGAVASHVGGDAAISGTLSLTGGSGLFGVVPDYVNYLDGVREDIVDLDHIQLPAVDLRAANVDLNVTAGNLGLGTAQIATTGTMTLNASGNVNLAGHTQTAGSFVINAGRGVDISGSTLNATGNTTVTAGTTLNASSATLAATTIRLEAGTNMSVSNVSLDGEQVALIAGGNITNSAPPGTISAGALAILAGGIVDLGNTTLLVGSGSIASVPGDTRFLELLAAQGIAVPDGGPNLVVRGQSITLGGGSLAGDYVYLETNNLTVNSVFNTSGPDLLLQVTPIGTGSTFSLEQSASGGGDAAYVYDDMLDRFNAGTIALGSTNHAGNAGISANSEMVDIGDTNLFVLTSGKITGLERVVSSGIVKDLFTLINGTFDVPQTNEIDTSQDSALTLNDQYALDGGGTDEEEEGEEEGEDTDSDADVEEDDDSLIRQDTVDEEMMCR